VATGVQRKVLRDVEYRLSRAIVSPARHVIVRSMVLHGYFEFSPALYYPERWSKNRMLHFTYHRLPLDQSVLSNMYQVARLFWVNDLIRVERVQRTEKFDPVIRTTKEAQRRVCVPSCF
jgi:hypothetical protein